MRDFFITPPKNWKLIFSTFLLWTIFFSPLFQCYASSDKLTIHDQYRAYPGFTLFYSFSNKRVVLLDMQGNVVYSLNMRIPGGNPEPLLNRNILAHNRVGTGGNSLVEVDWDGNIVWEIYNRNYSLHHDQERLKNGNYLVLGSKAHNAPSIKQGILQDDFILEINRRGNIVWGWLTSDYFDSFDFSDEALQLIWEGTNWKAPLDDYNFDIFHSNSIQSLPKNKWFDQGDVRFKPGNILVSQRNTNTVFIIDKESGEIVWKIGPENNITIGQHNANMIPQGYPGAGNILIFDNGGKAGYPLQTRDMSRVIEVNSDKAIEWEYTASDSGQPNIHFYSMFMGSAQRLPNGNTLICEAMDGRIFEVTRRGQIVWEYLHNDPIYRAYRVSLSWWPHD